MIFSYNWLQSFFKDKLPKPKKVAELLTLHSFEVQEVKKKGSDFVLDIDILPNRGPDCFSHLGIAKELAVIGNLKFQFPAPKPKEDKRKANDFVKIKVKNKNDCPRYSAKVITEVKVSSSPKWIKDRLRACGLRPINNIVDIANFVMLETGQPLHAFDLDKIAEKTIIIRRAKKGERIVTLDEEKYILDKDVLAIADPKKILAIAGIKGGKKTEIDKKTKNIVLESANFNPKIIRQGSKKINLKTDASWRFEHGIDPNLTELAINRAAYLIQEIARGKQVQGLVDFYPQKVLPKKLRLNLDLVKDLLGIKITENEIKKILESLEFKISGVEPRKIEVEVPTRRLDISLPEDLAEEIGRIKGLGRISSIFPQVTLIPSRKNLNIFWENFAKNILKEAGFSESYNRSFVNKKEAQTFNYKLSKLVEIKNPISLDYQYLRPSLIIHLLENVKENQKFFNEIRIFELGKAFKNLGSKSKIANFEEKRMLTGAMTGDAFYQTKGIIDLLLNKLGISNVWYDEYQASPEESKISLWNLGFCAEIKVDNKEIGFLGEISPKILKELKIKGKVAVFDLDFEKLQKISSEEHEYMPISAYPAAIRDLAILVPKETKMVEILNKINIIAGSLLRDIDLFDIYEGEEIPKGKKNLAFHLVYQAEDRTLRSEEIDKIQRKIIKTLEQDPEWEVRR